MNKTLLLVGPENEDRCLAEENQWWQLTFPTPQKKKEANCHSGRKCVKAEERLEKKSRFDRFSFSVKEAASE